eukprot:Gb_08755 [translate_table: standard]
MSFTIILFIRVLNLKGISIYNEEIIIAYRSIGFIIFNQKSLGNTTEATPDGRIRAIRENYFPNPDKVISLESNNNLLGISLHSIMEKIIEPLPNEMARYAPNCEKIV